MRRALAAAYVVYLLALGYLVFTPGGGAPGGAMELLDDLLTSLGITPSFTQLEAGSNVLLFVPLSLLGHFVFRRPGVLFWLLVGAVASTCIEVVQLVIPERVSSVRDIVANAAGAAIGAVCAIGLAAWGRRAT